MNFAKEIRANAPHAISIAICYEEVRATPLYRVNLSTGEFVYLTIYRCSAIGLRDFKNKGCSLLFRQLHPSHIWG